MEFSADEWQRYTRHIQLPQIGAAGQIKLKQAHVLIIGAGGLGSPVSLYLAAAGVGRITIVDDDHIDISNLQRQILFTSKQVGQSKALCAKARLEALNPHIQVTAITARLHQDNADALISKADLVLDCTDNFTTRYIINDFCLQHETPWIFASIYQFSGQCALFTSKADSTCFRCLFPDAPTDIPDCNTAGVVGVLPGLLGTLQANEAIKYLSGLPCQLANTLMLVEALELQFRKIQLSKNTDCICCNKSKLQQITYSNVIACETENFTSDVSVISKTEFDQIKDNDDVIIIDVRSEAEHKAFHLGGINIPINQLNNRLSELDRNKMIIIYCHSGIRSEQAVKLLKDKGYNTISLKNGVINSI